MLATSSIRTDGNEVKTTHEKDDPMPATKTRTLALTCPCCGAKDAAITLRLDDLSQLECSECSESYTPAEAVEKAREALARWEAFSAWLDAAPVAD
jgi:transcription elongation factor Elf1